MRRLAPLAVLLALFVVSLLVVAAVATCKSSESSESGDGAGGGPAVEGPADPSLAHAEGTEARAPPRARHRPADEQPRPPSGIEIGGEWFLVGGTVRRPDGAPQPGALVLLGDLDGRADATTTDGQGRFGFEWDGDYSSLHAIAEDDGTVLAGSVEPAFMFHGDITLRPRAPENGLIVFRIEDDRGRPVRSARVLTWSAGARPRVHQIRPGAAGRVAVRAWDEFLLVEAAIGEGGALGPALIRLDAAFVADFDVEVASPPFIADPLPPRAIRLPPGRSLRGRVILPDGHPAAWASLRCEPPVPPGWDADHMETPFEWVRCDADGVFAKDGLCAGTASLYVETKPGVHGGGRLEVAAGTDDAVLRLRPEWRLVVCVLDERGEPLDGARILAGQEGSMHAPVDGVYLVDGLPGGEPIEIRVDARGYVSVERHFEAPPDEPVTVRLMRDAPIRGRAWGPDGRPLVDVPLYVPAARRGDVLWRDDGSFEVRGLPPGEDPVQIAFADATGPVGAVFAPPGVADVRLVWPREDRLVILCPPHDEAADVVVRKHGAEIARGSVQRILALDVPPELDAVDVQIGPDAAGHAAYLSDVPAHGLVRVEWTPTHVVQNTVVRPDALEPGRLSGVVRIAGGQGFEIPFRTDVRGRFRVAGIPTGIHEVQIDARGLTVRAPCMWTPGARDGGDDPLVLQPR